MHFLLREFLDPFVIQHGKCGAKGREDGSNSIPLVISKKYGVAVLAVFVR
jgi:hypothetical protein